MINTIALYRAIDSAGGATQVQDAKGQVFATSYNNDGQVLSVTRTDTTPDKNIVSYTYGTSGVSNGMVTSVTDELSGIVQNISYIDSGNGVGQVYDVQEVRAGSTDNTVTYF